MCLFSCPGQFAHQQDLKWEHIRREDILNVIELNDSKFIWVQSISACGGHSSLIDSTITQNKCDFNRFDLQFDSSEFTVCISTKTHLNHQLKSKLNQYLLSLFKLLWFQKCSSPAICNLSSLLIFCCSHSSLHTFTLKPHTSHL